jgi:hypothetical protein
MTLLSLALAGLALPTCKLLQLAMFATMPEPLLWVLAAIAGAICAFWVSGQINRGSDRR